MKTLVLSLITLLIFSVSVIGQNERYYTFSELKGMEDQAGNTHLFYRLYYYYNENDTLETENSIYHIDLNNETDTLFLYDGGINTQFNEPEFTKVTDYEFWNNNPEEYIYSGYIIDGDTISYIKRYDNDGGYEALGKGITNIAISKQNDSLLYASDTGLLKSTDGGRNWEEINPGITLQSVSPFDDDIIFGSDSEGNLLKSTNGGNNFLIVDTTKSEEGFLQQFIYDPGGLHIYRIIKKYGEYKLSVSSQEGNSFSWQVKFSSERRLNISMDNFWSGVVFLSSNSKIYKTYDYGENFEVFMGLSGKIIGIYKKPNSAKLYAATKYNINEIYMGSLTLIKHLPIHPDILNYYPLAIGNKWYYSYFRWNNWPYWEQTDTIFTEITDTVTLANNKKYFVKGNSFERIDSLNGKVYSYDTYNNNERVIWNLLLEVGDTLHSRNLVFYEEDSSYNFKGYQTIQRKYREWTSPTEKKYMLKNIGYQGDEAAFTGGGSVTKLFACVINGIVYGDTTTVSVKDEKENIPDKFLLYQNYPNPFNPTTTIKYAVGSRQLAKDTRSPLERGGRGVLTRLTVYDILGREVIKLVNEVKQPGVYEVEFDGSDLSSGIYYYQLKAGSYSETKKFILIK